MKTIAYFSSEYAFDDLPIFAGGLGVLATDYLRQAAAENFPLVSVGLFYHYGFAPADDSDHQRLDIAAAGWSLVERDGKPLLQSLRLGDETVCFRAWTRQDGSVNSYLLDCDVDENDPEQRRLTAFLYDKDYRVKFRQNLLLGLGGEALLKTLGIKPHKFHLNEGHTAFVAVARLAHHKRNKPYATFEELCESVEAETVATKHTVLSGAGLYINHDVFIQETKPYLSEADLPVEKVFALAQDPLRKDDFTTTRLMLRMAHVTNTVSKSHNAYEDKLHPESEFRMISITNGINVDRWQDEAIAAAKTPEELAGAHYKLKSDLIDFVNKRTNSRLQPDILTIAWARRIAAYKRPLELFEDLEYLAKIIRHDNRPVQVVIAGKPNVEDEVGMEIAREIGEHVLNSHFLGRIAYLSDYDLEVAHHLVRGSDVWLNTPQKGYEASGTSGMKAGINGVLQCSVSDGWVDEAELKQSGWVLPDINTADALYGYIEHEISPLFYDQVENGFSAGWARMMASSIKLIENHFTTKRMLHDYKRQLYKIR